MWRDVVCLMGGFISAYLIIKAVRSFFGGIGVVLLVLGGVEVFGNQYVTVTPARPSGEPTTVYYKRSDGYSGTFNISVGGTSGQVLINTGQTVHLEDEHGTVLSGETSAAFGSGWSSYAGDWTYATLSVSWGGLTMITNYNYQVCFTNDCPATWKQVAVVWSVGSGWTTNTFTLWSPGDVQCVHIQTNGWMSASAWLASCDPEHPPTQYNGGMSTNVSGSPGADTGGLINGLGTNAPVNSGTMTNSPSNIPTNGPVGDRFNSDQIVRAISAVGGILDADLKDLKGELGSGNAGTNTDYSGKLEQIRTNTQNTAEGIVPLNTNLEQLVNFFATNWIGATTYGGTNLGTILAGGSNSVKGTITTDYSGLTNGIGWATNFTGPENAMQVDLGNGWTLDFDIFNSVSGIGLVVLQAVPFIRNTLEWLICFALFWVVMDRLDEALRIGLMGLKPGIGAGLVVDWIQRLVTAPAVVVAVGTLLLMIPTLSMTVWGTWGILSGSGLGSSGAGLLERVSSIGTGSAFGAALAEFAYRSLIWFPYDTLVVAIWTWLVAFFLGQYYIVLLYSTLWLASRMLPVFVIWSVWQTIDIQAAQVRFENFTGSTVALTNGAEIVQLPAGISEEVVLTDGDWWSGTNGFTLTSGFWGVRAMGSTNDVGIYFSAAKGYTGYEWWLMGMCVGFTVFGGAWAVAVVRQGLLIRVQE